jgi:hypothetical protein
MRSSVAKKKMNPKSSRLIGIYRWCNYRNAERSFFHEPGIRRIPGRAALQRAARTRVKIMQPEKDVSASKVSRAGGRP